MSKKKYDFTERELNYLIQELKIVEKLKDEAKTVTEREKYEMIEDELANRFCRCIKKVRVKKGMNEGRAIGICTSSIFNKRGLQRHKFSCYEDKKSSKMNPQLLGSPQSKGKPLTRAPKKTDIVPTEYEFDPYLKKYRKLEKCKVTPICPKGYRRSEVVAIAKECGIKITRDPPFKGQKHMKELCAEINKLGGSIREPKTSQTGGGSLRVNISKVREFSPQVLIDVPGNELPEIITNMVNKYDPNLDDRYIPLLKYSSTLGYIYVSSESDEVEFAVRQACHIYKTMNKLHKCVPSTVRRDIDNDVFYAVVSKAVQKGGGFGYIDYTLIEDPEV